MEQSTFGRIHHFYRASKYQKALDLIIEQLSESVLGKDEKVEMHELGFKIYKLLKKKPDEKFLKGFVKSCFECEQYEKASKVAKLLIHRFESFDNLEMFLSSLIKSGQLSEIKKVSNQIVEYCLKRKNQKLLKSHFEILKENNYKLNSSSELLISLLEGNGKEFNEQVSPNDFEELVEHKEFSRIKYTQYKNILDLMIQKNITESKTNVDYVSVAKDLFNYCIQFDVNKGLVENILKLAINTKSKSLVDSVFANVEIEDSLIKSIDSELLKIIEDEKANYQTFEYDEEFDSATDLFDLDAVKTELDEEVKLEKQYLYLKKINKEKESFEKLMQIKRVNPDNKYVREYYDSVSLKEGSTLFRNNQDEKIIHQLVAEISKYDKNNNHYLKKEKYSNELVVRKSLQMNIDYSDQQGIKDAVTLCVMLNFLDSALMFCEKIKDLVERTYLKGSIYFEQKKYYKCIDLIDVLIEQEVVTAEEKIPLVYLQAESYRKLGNLRESVIRYTFIKKQNPNYRMVRQRLLEFENL